MTTIPNLTLQDERCTELDGVQYYLRPTMEVIFGYTMLMNSLDEANPNLEFWMKELRDLTHKGMRHRHSAEDIDAFLDKASYIHVINFLRNAVPGVDGEDFPGPPEPAALNGKSGDAPTG